MFPRYKRDRKILVYLMNIHSDYLIHISFSPFKLQITQRKSLVKDIVRPKCIHYHNCLAIDTCKTPLTLCFYHDLQMNLCKKKIKGEKISFYIHFFFKHEVFFLMRFLFSS